jgi:hypothetical protein
MPFCRRCGEPCLSQATRCQCGGTLAQPTTSNLLNNESDRWSSRYLTRSPTPASTPPPASTDVSVSNEPVVEGSSEIKDPTNEGGCESEFQIDDEPMKVGRGEGELEVFGNLLSTKDQWRCVNCEVNFKQVSFISPCAIWQRVF